MCLGRVCVCVCVCNRKKEGGEGPRKRERKRERKMGREREKSLLYNINYVFFSGNAVSRFYVLLSVIVLYCLIFTNSRKCSEHSYVDIY